MIRLLSVYLFFSFFSFKSYCQQVNSYADSVRLQYQIPELSYAVLTSANILEMKALGKHSVNLPDTATLSDRFHIGSNTKAMTAFLIAKFVESGKLSWIRSSLICFQNGKAKVK